MMKVLVFTVLLVSSPVFSLLEDLYRVESSCHVSCDEKFTQSPTEKEACRTGCGYSLLETDCSHNCEILSEAENLQTSCKYACNLPKTSKTEDAKEVLPVPVSLPKENVEPINDNSESEEELEQPRSIILIRLRERPVFMPPPDSMIDMDPRQMFQGMIERFQKQIEDLQKSFESPDDQPINEHTLIDTMQENSFGRDSNPGFEHAGTNNIISTAQAQLNQLILQQSRILIWSLISVAFLLSVLLLYMVIAICSSAPKRYTTISPKEIFLQSYDYENFINEKIQPNDDVFETADPIPIKLKLSTV